ncbi:ganglioside-induced differentiation-associated protein 1 [Galendromus occidentalis]|uniref:Ganglioside-induced differentiation-associated protein 1 n=1 Tax=Galendromus occidentalis TaxID=34638 RepID=A0AAJ6QW30_9ACAR|nr:ganglioside-induced differentiation-associated protein 1 [Galendromus occidentalis]
MKMSSSRGLILYHALPSSYSQKVVLALKYLNLTYESRLVNLFDGEQLEPWFLDLNPKGEVPTLKDGDLVLTDSADIIQHLNDRYDTRRSDEKLIPNPVTPVGRSVAEVNQLICSVKTFVLTFGAAFHPQHTENSTLSDEESKGRRAFVDKMTECIREKLAVAKPPYKESYTYKLTKISTGGALLKDENVFLAELKSTREVLERIEDHLSRSQGKWIFFDHLTLADISLAVLLYRIKKLGLQHHFWAEGSLPNVASYLDRVLKDPTVAESLS